jgi:hypothetical protein
VLVSHLPETYSNEYLVQLIVQTSDSKTVIDLRKLVYLRGGENELQVFKVSESEVEAACLDAADSMAFDKDSNSTSFSILLACSEQ